MRELDYDAIAKTMVARLWKPNSPSPIDQKDILVIKVDEIDRPSWNGFRLSFVLERLPQRTVVAATDASGFSGRKRSWRETAYAVKAREN